MSITYKNMKWRKCWGREKNEQKYGNVTPAVGLNDGGGHGDDHIIVLEKFVYL